MRVLINTDVELYPQTTMSFGDDEIVFPAVGREHEKTAGIEVAPEVAARWKAARDAWCAAQAEAERLVGREA